MKANPIDINKSCLICVKSVDLAVFVAFNGQADVTEEGKTMELSSQLAQKSAYSSPHSLRAILSYVTCGIVVNMYEPWCEREEGFLAFLAWHGGNGASVSALSNHR